ncbi:MAG: DUF1015 domain-containing protein [Nitrospirota bacterium]|nr:DUF1015 domain-containing protein [Nitrospirota bacterium]
MAEISAFQGLIYNPDKVSDQGAVVAPPYDIIPPAGQEALYNQNPYNVIRLELGKEFPTDSENDNRYTRAAGFLKEWMDSQVLVRDSQPAIYLTHIRYNVKGVERLLRGFICLVRLEEFGTGKVLPHENTLSGPKTDRLNLMRTTAANFSQIFSLYSEPEGQVMAALEAGREGSPMIEVTDSAGYLHQVWRVSDTAAVGKVREILLEKPIYIADGHHRYETALNYCRERGGSVAGGSGEGFRHVMMFLANMDDDGLTVLPTHRVVKEVTIPPMPKLIEQLSAYFTIRKLDKGEEIIDALAEAGSGHHIGMLPAEGGQPYLLSLKDVAVMDEIFGDTASTAFRRLDVTILQSLILDRILGITPEMLKEHRYVHFIKNPDDADRATRSGEYSLAFFLNPTKIEEVRDVAAAGEKMPQKSTYFYPKLLTGLVLNKL